MQDIIIFDLDGTLALIEHRQHLVEGKKKKWKQFFAECVKDEPHRAVIEVLRALKDKYHIYIVSGRSSEVKVQTEVWLKEQNIPYDELIMRSEHDHTPDNQLKIRWVNEGRIPKDRILCVFDDRDKVVKMWRDNGIPCFQVAEGNF